MSFDILSLGKITEAFLPLDLSCIVKVGVSDLRFNGFLFTYEGLEIKLILFTGVLNSYFFGVLAGD
jgi:hypothetical protein